MANDADIKFENETNSSLLTFIQERQNKLRLTNRAVLSTIGIGYRDVEEGQFFAGKATHTIYVQTAFVLDSIFQSLKQYPFRATDYLQQLRTLPPRNIFLRNRYAFWFSNFTAQTTNYFL